MTINSTKIHISEKNLIHNMEYLKNTFNKKILAVVKSNAYGHDINLITKILFKHGYKYFAVARLCEAEKIITDPELKNSNILIFESIGKDFLKPVKENKTFHMSINAFAELKEALEYGISPEQIQLKIDFGFGRNGIELKDLESLKNYIEKYNLNFAGIYSHLFSVKYDDGVKIINKFKEIVSFLGKERFKMIHLQNSLMTETFGNLDITTHIRVGELIYGIQSEVTPDKNLKQIFSLKGKIAGIRNLENSNYLAYNLKSDLKVNKCRFIAKIKIGYGDGFLKINENTKCLINGREFKISLITMDNSFIEVDETIKEGDEVIFYPDIYFSRPAFNMSIYELLTILNSRIERVLD